MSYPEKVFGNPKALRAFISTNAAPFTQEIFSGMCRWPIEVYFSASVRINWYWTAIRYALHRESKGTGYLCHWHISCVQWVLVGSVRLKPDITKSRYHSVEKVSLSFQCAKESNDFDSFMKFCSVSLIILYFH